MFKIEYDDWTKYRNLPNHEEVDFHFNDDPEREYLPYYEAMEEVWNLSLNALKRAHEAGLQYVIFTHGWSTSQLGKTTARSQVRSLMRSKESTPYIIRKQCIQHESVFVAAIRPKKDTKE